MTVAIKPPALLPNLSRNRTQEAAVPNSKDELTLLDFIKSFRRGELLAEADGMFGELMTAIRETGGKGQLSIILPFKINDGGQIECIPKVDLKKPRRSMGTGIYYVTDDGRLTRRDPAQDDLFDEDDRRSLISPN